MGDTEEPPVQRRVVFVVGSGRSGTSTMAGALQTLGMHVPQPEVAADETNPKGFGEPQWVVDFHHELLKRCNVQVSDARPAAWYETGKLGTFGPLRMRLHEWLEPQFGEAPELVIKDPRLAWFVGLWRSAALRCDATPSYVTLLRPVTEVVGSKQRYYTTKFGEVQRTAAWVNMMLHTERAT
ncbi:MAG TPA: sulfotransferase family protein, partial [Nocardioides sp.]|nr:sulfotransferase family protein [Nocardioides sp.]